MSYAEQVAISVYDQLSAEDREAIAGGEFPLAAFTQAHERYRVDHFPTRPPPEWDRQFMRSLRNIARGGLGCAPENAPPPKGPASGISPSPPPDTRN